MRVCIKEDNDEIPSVPPGFESFTSFSLKRIEENEKNESDVKSSCSATVSVSESQPVQIKTEIGASDAAKTSRSLRRRPSINYGQYGESSEDENDPGKLGQASFVNFFLFIFFQVLVYSNLMYKHIFP